MGSTVTVLVVSAVILIRRLPELPARLPLHWNLSGRVDRLGSSSELWTLWFTAAGLALVLGLLAFNLPGSGQLNGMPQVPERDQPWSRQMIRSLVLALQLVVTLTLCGLLNFSIVLGSGGPNLIGFTLLPVVAVPVLMGYFLFKASQPQGIEPPS